MDSKLLLVQVGNSSSILAGPVDGDGTAVHWIDDAGAVHTRALATKRQEVVSIVVESKDEQIQAGGDGALFMLLKKSADSGTPLYSDMKALVANNIFPERIGDDVRAMMFPWVKVEDRPWAHGDFKVPPRQNTQYNADRESGPRVLQPHWLPRFLRGRRSREGLPHPALDGRHRRQHRVSQPP